MLLCSSEIISSFLIPSVSISHLVQPFTIVRIQPESLLSGTYLPSLSAFTPPGIYCLSQTILLTILYHSINFFNLLMSFLLSGIFSSLCLFDSDPSFIALLNSPDMQEAFSDYFKQDIISLLSIPHSTHIYKKPFTLKYSFWIS